MKTGRANHEKHGPAGKITANSRIASDNFLRWKRLSRFYPYICRCMKILALLALLAAQAPFIPMKWERLPDLSIPRASHQAFVANGELVVVGGHTTGFIRTATAEFFSDGEWHTLKTLYPNDFGFLANLPDGDFLIGGGSDEDFGVGQTYGVQRYNPLAHSFSPFPILDIKRAMATAAVLPDGRIIVSGNWYAPDAIGLSDGAGPFETVSEAAADRCRPYIFPYGKNEAVIFSGVSSRGEQLSPIIVDRLGGEPCTPAVFEQYDPYEDLYFVSGTDRSKAVNPATGRVTYLFSALDKERSHAAFLSFSEGVFSKASTDCEIPVEGPWGPIDWIGGVSVDRQRGTAYMMGVGIQDNRVYVAAIPFLPALEGKETTVKVYYTQPVKEYCIGAWVVLPDGRIVTTGGYKAYDPMGNYSPSAAVFAFYPFEEGSPSIPHKARWPWVLAGILVAAAGAYVRLLRRKRRSPAPAEDTERTTDEKESALFRQVSELMENERLYLVKGLTVAELATRLGSNTKYISSCINAGAGCSFVEFVNGYRIRHAQKQMRENGDLHLSEVADASGFSSESTFYRNFKDVTGLTPAEWMSRQKE